MLVRLAELAGVAPAAAFDIDAVAAGLAAIPAGALADPQSGVVDGAGVADEAMTVAPPASDRPVPRIEFDGLVHRYANGVEAIRGVSLRIEPGEAVAIVGPNGSGKTTLAKHLDGLLRPAEGEVRLDGRSIAADPIARLAATVGFVFQDPADQLFERSVEREVAFGPRNLGFAADRTAALVDAALAATGLDGERTTNPYDLDPTGRKLVALAAVLAMDPAILVLDEPTTGQDPAGVARVRAIVDAWRAAGRTVIAITHDLAFAAAAFGRVLVLRDGALVDDGPPERVLAASVRAARRRVACSPHRWPASQAHSGWIGPRPISPGSSPPLRARG